MRCGTKRQPFWRSASRWRLAVGTVQVRQLAELAFSAPGSVDIVGGLCACGEAQDIST